MALDSDVDFEAEGGVIGMVRGIPGRLDLAPTFITVAIRTDDLETTNSKNVHVDLPIRSESDFDIIPYQLGLVGNRVKYSKKYTPSPFCDGCSILHWALQVQSGPLKGNTYRFSR